MATALLLLAREQTNLCHSGSAAIKTDGRVAAGLPIDECQQRVGEINTFAVAVQRSPHQGRLFEAKAVDFEHGLQGRRNVFASLTID